MLSSPHPARAGLPARWIHNNLVFRTRVVSNKISFVLLRLSQLDSLVICSYIFVVRIILVGFKCPSRKSRLRLRSRLRSRLRFRLRLTVTVTFVIWDIPVTFTGPITVPIPVTITDPITIKKQHRTRFEPLTSGLLV